MARKPIARDVLLTFGIAALVLAVEAGLTSARSDSLPARTIDAATLVQQLGSASFKTREAAEQQLKALGPAALPALKTGAASRDAEIAERCRRIEREIRKAEIEALVESKQEPGTEIWKQLRTLLGDSRETRRLYAEWLADDVRSAALQKAGNPADAFDEYKSAIERATASTTAMFRRFTGQPLDDEMKKALRRAMSEALPPAEVAAILWLGRHPIPAGKKDIAPSRNLFGAGMADALEGASKAQYRQLFAAWLERRTDPAALQAGMDASLHFGLAEGVPTARRILSDKSMPPLTIGKALLVLGHHGRSDDVTLVAKFRNDDRAVKTGIEAGVGTIGAAQVRDVAVAMALKLSGEEFEKYGFGADKAINSQIRLEPAPFRSVSIFKSDEARTEAHKKAWTWLDAQPKKTGDADR
jgi:hypothetical protein